MQKKKRLVIILSIIVILLSAVMVFVLTTLKPSTDVVEPNPTTTPTTTTETVSGDSEFLTNKAINDDYIAQLKFESGLLNFPVLQGETNDTYITTEWQSMEYDIEGSIFMDYRNIYEGENEDENLVIYGHYVYADERAKFGPLHDLKEESNYEANKYITLEFENEIRRYEVARVFYCQLVDDGNGNYLYTQDDMQYYHTNFDEEYFDVYMQAIEDNQFYDTGVEISHDDHLLTLQTCVRNRDDLRLIVIAKEISRTPITR